MTEALTNHLWQSTVFGAMAWLLTLVLRKNHARARYWVWLAASVKFLIPFALLVEIGSHFGFRKTYFPAAAPLAVERFGPVFTPVLSASITSAKPHPISWLPILLGALWACGCAAVLLAWCVRWRRTARIIRTAEPLTEGREVETLRRLQSPIEIVSSNARFEPGVFGIRRPILLWPAGISERLADAQIEAILAHELSHVRRRDNLAAALHMLVEAVFWFHPLVWWIGARLMAERENACDQDVLRLESEPEVYAEGILKVCEYCLEAPLLCVSGVSGADLKKRIQGIMTHTLAHDLGWSRRLLLAVAGIAAIAAPIGIGLMNAPATEAQSVAANAPTAYTVASIKPNKSSDDRFMLRPMPGGGLTATAVTLKMLMGFAYGVFAYQISGGPAWIGTERWDIEAKSDAVQGQLPPAQSGALLRALIEDRFQLKVRRESKEMPVYELVVTKNGPKLKPNPDDPTKSQPSAMLGRGSGTFTNSSMAVLAARLSQQLGRPVIDRTDLKGGYDFTLEWTPASGEGGAELLGLPPRAEPPATGDSNGPSLFTALQDQLGLKLEPQKGPVDMIIIDHVARASEN